MVIALNKSSNGMIHMLQQVQVQQVQGGQSGGENVSALKVKGVFNQDGQGYEGYDSDQTNSSDFSEYSSSTGSDGDDSDDSSAMAGNQDQDQPAVPQSWQFYFTNGGTVQAIHDDNLNQQDVDGVTPLWQAVEEIVDASYDGTDDDLQNQRQIFQDLIDRGCDVNQVSNTDSYPIQHAQRNGLVEVVEILLNTNQVDLTPFATGPAGQVFDHVVDADGETRLQILQLLNDYWTQQGAGNN